MTDILLENAIILITGAYGTGKTTLAHTYTPPIKERLGRVFCHDSERSANQFIQQIGNMGWELGYYGDLQTQFTDLPSNKDLLSRIGAGNLPWVDKREKNVLKSYYQHVLDELVEKLTPGSYDTYIMDTIEKFEAGMYAWCEDNFGMFGFSTLRESKANAKIWTQIFYPLYEKIFAGIFARGVKTIILTSHLHNVWRDNKPVPDLVAPGGKPRLALISTLTIWLVNDIDNAGGEPAGLVLKERLGKTTVEDGEWVLRRMLPRRIPQCTWKAIRGYLESGCDLANPPVKEVWTDAEERMARQLLSDEQMRLMILEKEKELEEAKHGGHPESIVQSVQSTFSLPIEDPLVARYREKAEELLEQGKSTEEIKEELEGSLPPPIRANPNSPAMKAIGKAVEELQ